MRLRRLLYLVLLLLSGVLIWQIVEVRTQPLPAWEPTIPQTVRAAIALPPLSRPAAAEGEGMVVAIAEKNPLDVKRGKKDPPPPAPQYPPPTHLKLVGVALTAEQKAVVLLDSSQGGKVLRLRAGETIGPYRLQEITPTTALFTYGNNLSATLSLVQLRSGEAAKGPRMEIPPPKPAAPKAAPPAP